MARKLIGLLLLAAAWVGLHLLNGGTIAPSAFFFPPTHPSQNPLPQPWADRQVVVRLFPQERNEPEEPQAAGGCPSEYSVRQGDTLGQIAARCGVQIADLQALNPALTDPNRIYPGQQLVIYGRVSNPAPSLTSSKAARAAPPGSAVPIEAAGLPPGANARVGVGLSSAGYWLAAQARVGEDGVLRVEVTLPAQAQPGDHAFILVTTTGETAVQAVSETFVIGP